MWTRIRLEIKEKGNKVKRTEMKLTSGCGTFFANFQSAITNHIQPRFHFRNGFQIRQRTRRRNQRRRNRRRRRSAGNGGEGVGDYDEGQCTTRTRMSTTDAYHRGKNQDQDDPDGTVEHGRRRIQQYHCGGGAGNLTRFISGASGHF